jgi:hypothetical protein
MMRVLDHWVRVHRRREYHGLSGRVKDKKHQADDDLVFSQLSLSLKLVVSAAPVLGLRLDLLLDLLLNLGDGPGRIHGVRLHDVRRLELRHRQIDHVHHGAADDGQVYLARGDAGAGREHQTQRQAERQ